MAKVPRIDITADDIRDYARQKGIDPDNWNYVKKGNGAYAIRKGILEVGEMLLEDTAKFVVDCLNKRYAAQIR